MKLFGHYDCGGQGAGLDRHKRQKPTISVAGYLATAGQWWELDRKWTRRLQQDSFRYFHMTDFMANKKGTVFEKCKSWDENRKLAFLSDLSNIILGNVTCAIGMAVYRTDYDRVLADEPNVMQQALGGPFTFCAFRCFESGVDWSVKHRSQDAINYIFEQGDPGADQVYETHKLFSDVPLLGRRYWLGSLRFETKCNTSLQAADLLTWALNRELYHQLYPEPEYEYIRPTLTNLLGGVENIYKGYYEDDIRGYIDDLMDKEKRKTKHFIIAVPKEMREELTERFNRGEYERKNRVPKVRRNNARTVSSAAKRATKGTSKRRANKSAKRKAAR